VEIKGRANTRPDIPTGKERNEMATKLHAYEQPRRVRRHDTTGFWYLVVVLGVAALIFGAYVTDHYSIIQGYWEPDVTQSIDATTD
jgi:hypothetical protein